MNTQVTFCGACESIAMMICSFMIQCCNLFLIDLSIICYHKILIQVHVNLLTFGGACKFIAMMICSFMIQHCTIFLINLSVICHYTNPLCYCTNPELRTCETVFPVGRLSFGHNPPTHTHMHTQTHAHTPCTGEIIVPVSW